MNQELINWYYDPARQGYDTSLFKTVAGTPTISNSELVLNAASFIGYADIKEGDFTFSLNIPTVPTPGDGRSFGLVQENANCGIIFNITDAVFTVGVIDMNGTATTKTVTFEPTWAGTAIKYKISWVGPYVYFYINGAHKITINSPFITTPLSIFMANANSDDMVLQYLEAQNIKTYI